MTTGEQGRTAPDAEHYLDLSDVPEEAAGPRFDVVLRGYDRRQVDEHVAGLRRMVSQLRAQLAVRERRRGPADGGVDGSLADTLSEGRPAAPAPPPAPATTPLTERSDAPAGNGQGGGPDMVGAFNDRLRGILQAAEQEAQMVRSRAAESLLAEHAESRAALAELRAQRDAVFDELMRARNRLDDIVAHSGRPSAPPRGAWGAPAGPPRGAYAGGPPGAFGAAPGPRGPGAEHADVDADTAGDSGELTVDAVSGAGRGNGSGRS